MSLPLVAWIVVGIGALAIVYFFGLPWVKPLYLRYREWVAKTASGNKG